MYSIVLRSAGHDVYEAEDGPTALAVFNRTPLDVAIVDIGLPGMDGYELARQIRSAPEGRNVTLIALTGYGLPDDRKRSAGGRLRSAPGQTRRAGRPPTGHGVDSANAEYLD